LLRRKMLPCLRRRHTASRFAVGDALNEHAFGRFTRHNGKTAAATELGPAAIFRIQSKPGLPLASIGPVTGEAVLGEHGEDLTIEVDLRQWRGCFGFNCPGIRNEKNERLDD